jgi:hypothetical protein
VTLLRRLLAMLGLAPREVPDLAARVEPYFGPPKVANLKRERLARMPPVVFVNYKSASPSPRSHPAAQALLAGVMQGMGEREKDEALQSAGATLGRQAQGPARMPWRRVARTVLEWLAALVVWALMAVAVAAFAVFIFYTMFHAPRCDYYSGPCNYSIGPYQIY